MQEVINELTIEDIKVLGCASDLPDFYELIIDLHAHVAIEPYSRIAIGYDTEAKKLHIIEFSDSDEYEDIDEFVIKEYTDCEGYKSIIVDPAFVDICHRHIMKDIREFIQLTENDERIFKLLDRAILEYIL